MSRTSPVWSLCLRDDVVSKFYHRCIILVLFSLFLFLNIEKKKYGKNKQKKLIILCKRTELLCSSPNRYCRKTSSLYRESAEVFYSWRCVIVITRRREMVINLGTSLDPDYIPCVYWATLLYIVYLWRCRDVCIFWLSYNIIWLYMLYLRIADINYCCNCYA